MNSLYKIIGTMFTCCVLLASCVSEISYYDAMSKNQRKIEDPKKLADAEFLVEAKSYNILESRLATLAITSGYSAAVVNMSRQQLEDYNNLSKEMDNLARKEKIALPAMMKEEHLRIYNEAVATERTDFDKNYLRLQKSIKEEMTQKFMHMATEAADDDIRGFAARKLNMLRSHEARMEEVDNVLMKTY